MNAPDTQARDRIARLLVDSVHGRAVSVDGIVAADVVAAADMHRITPAVARAVAGPGEYPPGWEAPLVAARHAQLFRHMRTSADLDLLGRTLADAGVRWVVGKGPAAADLLWPHPDMREYYDVDVFVARRSFAPALEALLADGFALVDRNWPELQRTRRAEVALRAPNGSHVDLHWHIAVTPGLRRTFPVAYDEMIERAVQRRLGSGVTVGVFDPADTMLHLAFHAFQAGANRLMWIGDLHYAAAADGFDWDRFHRRATAARLDVPLSIVLARVRRTLGFEADPPAGVLRPSDGIWGRLVRRREAVTGFPGLPGDRNAGGIDISSTRPHLAASVGAATCAAVATRAVERRVRRLGPEQKVLYRDVPEPDARRAYLRDVASDR